MENETKQETTEKQDAKTDVVEMAVKAAERLEAANKRQEELISQQKDLEARRILGGKSAAGEVPEKPKVETPKEYADRIMRGGK